MIKKKNKESVSDKNEKKSLVKEEENDGSFKYKFRNAMRNCGNWICKFILNPLGRFFKNSTTLYILRRLVSSLLTLILLVCVVTALLRVIPEHNCYDWATYSKLRGQNATVAENWKNMCLYIYGRMDINGNRISVLSSVWNCLKNILPFPKTIPVRWNDTYTVVTQTQTWWIYLGRSFYQKENISVLIQERVGISFLISLVALTFSYIVSWPLGVLMAKKPGGWVDKLGNALVVINYAIPSLIFYLVVQRLFGKYTGLSFQYDPDNKISILPAILAITIISLPGQSIWVRRFMVDEMGSDYVKFARAKGLPENTIMFKHVLRNACVPLVRSIPASLLGCIVGSYYVERIWGIPGTGALLIQALSASKAPDVPLVQGLTLLYGAISMLAFLLGDIVTVLIDPRIKLASR